MSPPGAYELLHPIAEGGMGAVFMARHRASGGARVIKMVRQDAQRSEQLIRRFARESRLMVHLRHPNVARAFASNVGDEGTACLVLEFIDGVTFEALSAAPKQPSLGLAVELACQGLAAIQCLHQQDIVHRDIAADNLMVMQNPAGEPQVKLIDLGIAKRTSSGSDALTNVGTFLGKARYTAPEQFAGGGATNLNVRSDLYSFGVLLYELLTGRRPIAGRNFSEVLSHHLFKPPVPFDTSDPEARVPEGLRRVVLQALEKEAENRMASAGEFLDALAPFLEAGRSHQAEVAQIFDSIRREVAGGEVDQQVSALVERIFPANPDPEDSMEDTDHGRPAAAARSSAVSAAPRATAAEPASETPETSGLKAKEEQAPDSWEGRTVRTSVPDFVLREQARRSGPAALLRRHWMWLLLLLVVLAMVLSRVLGD